MRLFGVLPYRQCTRRQPGGSQCFKLRCSLCCTAAATRLPANTSQRTYMKHTVCAHMLLHTYVHTYAGIQMPRRLTSDAAGAARRPPRACRPRLPEDSHRSSMYSYHMLMLTYVHTYAGIQMPKRLSSDAASVAQRPPQACRPRLPEDAHISSMCAYMRAYIHNAQA